MKFTYEPLGAGKIRLVEFDNRSAVDISLILRNVPLHSAPNYTTLSYTWQLDAEDPTSPPSACKVELDGKSFEVGRNLYDALHQLQHSSRTQRATLWIDAICINQTDEREKSVQVSLMREIYERANSVIVWLGKPDDEDSNRLAFQRIKQYRRRWHDVVLKNRPYRPFFLPKTARTIGDDVSSFVLSLKPATDKSLSDLPGSDTHRAWVGIAALWSKRWWRRTWVLQEATVPETTTAIYVPGASIRPKGPYAVKFWCGAEEATWPELEITFLVASNISRMPNVVLPMSLGVAGPFSQLLDFRTKRVLKANYNLLEILQIFRLTDCANARDKVYSPLCLASELARAAVVPDYTKSVRDIFLSVVQYQLQQEREQLLFLGYTQYREPTPNSLDLASPLPSWLPNWATKLAISPIPNLVYPPKAKRKEIVFYDRRGVPTFENEETQPAYSPLPSSIPSAAYLTYGDTKLHLHAVFIDRIKDTIPNTGRDPETVRRIGREKGRQWAIDAQHRYFTGETWADAINRTIVLDLEFESEYARPISRGGKRDGELLAKSREHLSAEEYGRQKGMRIAVTKANKLRMLGLSEEGFSMMVPETARVGDGVWAFAGGHALYVLRELRHEERECREFVFLGEGYAHGLMDGEVGGWLASGRRKMEEICLV